MGSLGGTANGRDAASVRVGIVGREQSEPGRWTPLASALHWMLPAWAAGPHVVAVSSLLLDIQNNLSLHENQPGDPAQGDSELRSADPGWWRGLFPIYQPTWPSRQHALRLQELGVWLIVEHGAGDRKRWSDVVPPCRAGPGPPPPLVLAGERHTWTSNMVWYLVSPPCRGPDLLGP